MFSDSQAAIQRLQATGNHVAQKARAVAHQLTALGITIVISWCPGHTGVTGNEIADQQAKLGLQKPPCSEAYASFGHLRGLVKMRAKEAWKQAWAEEDLGKGRGQGKQYRAISQDALSFSLTASNPITVRSALSAYIQLKTGIGYIRAYQVVINRAESDCCFGSCKERQTTAHLLLRCPQYEIQRRKLRKALNGQPLTLRNLFGTTVGKLALASFLQRTRICTAEWYRNAGLIAP